MENILIVDDEMLIRVMLSTALSQEGFTCHLAENVDEAFSVLEERNIDLVILDIMMPGRSGVEMLEDLKRLDHDMAVLMVTGVTDTNTAMECIRLGADDYLSKPFSLNRVVLTVRNLMERRSLALERKQYHTSLESRVREQTEQIRCAMLELRSAYNDTLTALVKALDAREKDVGSHSERVMNYSELLAARIGLDGTELHHLSRGALLHDIGKIGVADRTLLKTSRLDDREWHEIRRHPQVGYDILSEISFLKAPAEIILNHHERFDGAGYPNGLKGEEIPLGARIFGLVDTLDAMTTDRPYRKALPFGAVIDEVIRCRGSQFDPRIADIFLSIPRGEWEECVGRKFI